MKHIISLVTITVIGIAMFGAGCWNRTNNIQVTPSTPVQDVTSTPPVVGGDRDAHGCIGSAGYQWCEPKQQCLRFWEDPCYDSPEEAIKAALAKELDLEPNDIFVKISTLTDKFAKGSVGRVGEENDPAGMFLASQGNYIWLIDYHGNGQADCPMLIERGYPADMLKNFCDVKDDSISVTTPKPQAQITSPLHIQGQARGEWYFEAVFPIQILDANNKVIGQGNAQAQSDWATSTYVPFTADISFTAPTTPQGTLVLSKDNPSGLPQNDYSIRIPVTFNTATTNLKLYYYNSSLDKDASGNILCSKQGLVAVNREVPKTIAPIQDAIKELLKGNLSAAEKTQGITTEFPLSGVALKGASLKSGVLTLEFTDPQSKTSGGSCRSGVLWAQIEATAKQFKEVTAVKFIPDTLFQP